MDLLRQLGWRSLADAVLRRAAAGVRQVARSLETRPSASASWFVGALRAAPALTAAGAQALVAPRELDDTIDPRLRWEAGRGGHLIALASDGDRPSFERAVLRVPP